MKLARELYGGKTQNKKTKKYTSKKTKTKKKQRVNTQ